MKKRISFILAVIIILAAAISAIPVYAAEGTDGNFNPSSEASVLEIWGPKDLEKFLTTDKSYSGQTIKLCCDVTLDKTFTSINSSAFEGTFDGQGHTISGYEISGSGSGWYNGIGLFAKVTLGTIKNFTLENFNVSADGAKMVGGLVAYFQGGTIENVTMKNGTVDVKNLVECNTNQHGAGAVFGRTYYEKTNGNIIWGNEGCLTKIQVVVEQSVKLIGDSTTNGYLGGFGGNIDINTNGCGSLFVDMTDSKIQPTDSNGEFIETAVARCGRSGNSNARFFNSNANASIYTDTGNADITKKIDNFKALGVYGSSYIDPVVKFVGVQKRSSDNGIRFVGLIQKDKLDSLGSLGFTVTSNGVTADVDTVSCTKVYESIIANGETLTAPEGYYYFTYAVTDVSDSTAFTDITAKTVIGGSNYYTHGYSYTYSAAN